MIVLVIVPPPLFSFRPPSDGPRAHLPGSCCLTYWWIWIVIPWAPLDHCSPLFYHLLISVFLSNLMCLHSAVFFLFAAGYLVWPALFQVTTVEWRLAMPRPTQSSPGSTHFTYIILFVRSDILSAQVVNHDFAVLFCTSIACLSIQREPSSVAPPEVYSIFYSPIKNVFFSYYGMFFLTWIKGLMREDDVHYTDYHRFVIFGYMNEMDLIWFDLRDLRKKKKTAIHCDTTTEGSLIFSSLLRLLYLYCFSDLHFGKVRI